MPRRRPEDKDLHDNYSLDNDEDYTHDNPLQLDDNETVVVEIGEDGVTKKVKLNLEVDTSVKNLGVNPFKNIIHLARAFDSWRPFPRLFITVYIYLLYEVVRWAMSLESMTLEQSGLVSVIVGAGAAWFGLYVGSNKNPRE